MVWRACVSQTSVSVAFGARLRRAPVSVCLAFQNVCGAQEQCPESGFDLGRHVCSIAGGTDALSGAGDARGFHEFIGSRAAQCFQVSVEAFSADGRPGAFEQPHASHHVAHDSDDLGVVETVLAGSHIWRVIRGKRMLVSLDVDESPSDMLEA